MSISTQSYRKVHVHEGPTGGRSNAIRNPQGPAAGIELGEENQPLISLIEHVKAEYPSFDKKWLAALPMLSLNIVKYLSRLRRMER